MITTEQAEKIAELARLQFSTEELQTFVSEFGGILEYIDAINTIDLEHVEPLAQVSHDTTPWRSDVVVESLTTEQALSNAPSRNEVFFKVPKVIQR